jgi:diamine N-acetyltransferase
VTEPLVELVEVTADNVLAVCALEVAPHQTGFVTPNAISLAEASVHPQAWRRAVLADGELVGFVMMWDSLEDPGYMLWRLMVAAPHQGRGIGRAIVEQVKAYVATRPGGTFLKVSAHRGDGAPGPFYEQLGFVATGEVTGDDDGPEDVYRIEW